jgi:hypothetical protein
VLQEVSVKDPPSPSTTTGANSGITLSISVVVVNPRAQSRKPFLSSLFDESSSIQPALITTNIKSPIKRTFLNPYRLNPTDLAKIPITSI